MYLSPEESEAKDWVVAYCIKTNKPFIEYVRVYRKAYPELTFGQALIQLKKEVS